jgi:hypothetical protein
MFTSRRLFSSILLLSLLAGMFGMNVAPAAAAAGGKCTQYYTFKASDSLERVARKFKVTTAFILKINKLTSAEQIEEGDRICVSDTVASSANDPKGTWSGGKVAAVKVVEDSYAVLRGSSLPINTRFEILMSGGGSGVGTKVGTATTNSSGTFESTFNIPKKLNDVEQITARVRAGGKIYAEAKFANATNGSGSSSSSSGMGITVTRVVADESVTIQGSGFPTATNFNVYMESKKATVKNWIRVNTLTTGSSSSFSQTFLIPTELIDVADITIMFETKDGKSQVSVSFANVTGSGGSSSGSTSGSGTNKSDDVTITLVRVVKDSIVEVRFENLVANTKYHVYVGTADSKGSKGKKVGIFTADKKGSSVVMSYRLPNAINGETKLALRVESANGSAYLLFDNLTNQ